MITDPGPLFYKMFHVKHKAVEGPQPNRSTAPMRKRKTYLENKLLREMNMHSMPKETIY